MQHDPKDPERVRLGRLGGLTCHARGLTNVRPARKAWEANLAAEFGIGNDLDPTERDRRMRAAVRVRMARLARLRWASKKAAPALGSPGAARVVESNDHARRSTG